ncbi:hypothetical protein [Paludibaculum fermentans]|uniref:Intracellular proteinase inhibitor BsuPI domain-containing protein n=1 Tax=Paludibaculum fermentans TaxID=1473598 RepID=A0A7S7SJW7_PALFE|nr:hypothetical protein [Paludibaculum fermentans]QOY88522.1 hypothetical protein IRI77_00735 [Paludibaculum fermentans]
MRRALLSLLLLAGACASAPCAEPPIQEPRELDRIYAIGPDGSATQPLPLEPVKLTGKGNGRTVNLEGGRSALRFREGSVPAFVVRFAVGSWSSGSVRLYLLRSDAQQRSVKTWVWAYSSAERQEPGTVPSKLERYGKLSYRIVPPPVLRPGEYAIGLGLGSFGFTFGIDPK